jgi:hypothetical protein
MSKVIKVSWVDTTFQNTPPRFPTKKFTMTQKMYAKLTSVNELVKSSVSRDPALIQKLENIEKELARVIMLAKEIQKEESLAPKEPTHTKTKKEDKKETKDATNAPKSTKDTKKAAIARKRYMAWFKQFAESSNNRLEFREESDGKLLQYFLGDETYDTMLGYVDVNSGGKYVLWGAVDGFPQAPLDRETFKPYVGYHEKYVPAHSNDGSFEYWNKKNNEWTPVTDSDGKPPPSVAKPAQTQASQAPTHMFIMNGTLDKNGKFTKGNQKQTQIEAHTVTKVRGGWYTGYSRGGTEMKAQTSNVTTI